MKVRAPPKTNQKKKGKTMTEIVLRIKHNDTCIDIEFPIEESPLYAKLAELHATDHEGDPFLLKRFWSLSS